MVSRELGWALHVPRLCFVQLKTSRGGFINWLLLPFSAFMSFWHCADSSAKKESRKKGSDGSSSYVAPSGRSMMSTHLPESLLQYPHGCTASGSRSPSYGSLGASSPVSGESSVVGGVPDHLADEASEYRADDEHNSASVDETRERGVEELVEGNPRGRGIIVNGNLHHRRAAQRQGSLE